MTTLTTILLRARQHELSLGALQLLDAIHTSEAGKLTGTAAAAAMGISPAAITNLIDTLESKGFITREASLTDRRVKWLALTKTGTALLA